MLKLQNLNLESKNENTEVVRQYDHSPLVSMGYKLVPQKTSFDQDANCDTYVAAGNVHFKTAIANGESQLLAFETWDDAAQYVDSVLVKYRVPGIWHIAKSLEDGKFYVLPTRISSKK